LFPWLWPRAVGGAIEFNVLNAAYAQIVIFNPSCRLSPI
jgi:hypothetical protein